MTADIIGKTLKFKDIVRFPGRNSFLTPSLKDEVAAEIKAGAPTMFLPVKLWETYLPEKNGMLSLEDYSMRMYKIVLMGILRSGEKVTVVIDGLQPYFEIRVPRDANPQTYLSKIQQVAGSQNFKVRHYDIVEGLTSKEFDDKAHFIVLKFSNINQRLEALKWFDANKYETYHDDLNSYYRVVSRDTQTNHINWSTLNKYNYSKTHHFFDTPTFHVHYKSYNNYGGDILQREELKFDRTIEVQWDIETHDSKVTDDIPRPESATADMFMICMSFVYTNGDVLPKDCDPKDPRYDYPLPEGHLMYVRIVTVPTAPAPNRVTIECADESEAIQAFGLMFKLMKPDYVVDFNGSNYDWPWVVYRAHKYGLLSFLERNMSIANLKAFREYEKKAFQNPKTAEQYYWYQKYMFKLTPDLNLDGRTLCYPGYVCVDLIPQLRLIKENPDKWSLNYFLSVFGIGSKVDMPYKRMFRIYTLSKRIAMYHKNVAHLSERVQLLIAEWLGIKAIEDELRELMQHVAEYCTMDAARCHDLLVKTCFIRDTREKGALSLTTNDDCIYRANGMKVRNMAISEGTLRGVRMSNKPPKIVEKGKYPGAYVIPPKKGLKCARLSLEEIAKLKDRETRFPGFPGMENKAILDAYEHITRYGIHWHAYPPTLRETLPVWFQVWLQSDHDYPIGALDFASLYPSLIMAYNFSPETMVHTLVRAVELKSKGYRLHPVSFMFNGRQIQGWTVRHDFKGDLTDLKSNFGVFPTILKKLFDSRVVLKSQLKPITSRKEHLESLPPEEFAKVQAEYKDLVFRYNYLNSKQKALKIFMNTFYGESGNALSPIRVLALAGGVTTSGQANLKMVAELVQKLGCKLMYGDTDSCYIGMPPEAFAEIDRLYYSGKINKQEYYKRAVEIAFKEIERIKNVVNKALAENNGTNFLNMSYEELLWNVIFAGKKKYVGIPHEAIFNMYPKKLFCKGLDHIKKGASKLLKKIMEGILWRALAIDNTQTLSTIIEEKIHEVYTSKHPDEDFIKSAQYKPPKNGKPGNPSVLGFVKRMQELGKAPEPLERFQYKIAKKYPYKYDIRGRKQELSIADRMEYPWRMKELGLEEDLDYYMSKNIAGQLARLALYHKQFHVEPHDNTPESYDEAEKLSLKAATKWVLNQYKRYSTQYTSKGPIYQQLFKRVNDVFQTEFGMLLPSQVIGMTWDVSDSKTKKGEGKAPAQEGYEENGDLHLLVLSKIGKQASKDAKVDARKFFNNIRARDLNSMMMYKKVYMGLVRERTQRCHKNRVRLTNRLRALMRSIKDIFAKRNQILMSEIQNIKRMYPDDSEQVAVNDNYFADLDDQDMRLSMRESIRSQLSVDDIKTIHRIDTVWIELYAYERDLSFTQQVLDNINIWIRNRLGMVDAGEANHTDDLNEFIDKEVVGLI